MEQNWFPQALWRLVKNITQGGCKKRGMGDDYRVCWLMVSTSGTPSI
jgi:hypothetical protein